jgi:hypothetical protein
MSACPSVDHLTGDTTEEPSRILEYTGGPEAGSGVSLLEYRLQTTYWFEALPSTYEWPGLGSFPDVTKKEYRDDDAKRLQWRNACYAYGQTLHADPKY